MNKILNRYKHCWYALLSILTIGTSFLMNSCSNDEVTQIVDLRYRANDNYTLSASNPEEIKIQVKSSETWMVFSDHPDWCTISPEQGEAETTFDVIIQYKVNTELDDRTDTITVQSDYWIGKWITVLQKGTAYLNTENAENILLSKEEGPTAEASFNVLANQKWVARITKGEEWLSMKSDTDGSNDGIITVSALPNRGEKRYGEVTLYDRHNVIQQTVIVTQDGIQIDPETILFHESYEEHTVAINVISNGAWTVAKDDDSQEWYSFSNTSFNGNGKLLVSLNENAGTSVRKATFQLSSEVLPGVEPVMRTITVKQAFNGTEHYEFNVEEGKKWEINNGTCSFSDNGFYSKVGRIIRSGMQPGYYSFHIKSMAPDAQTVIFFTYGASEIRWHLSMATGRTNYSTSPYAELPQKTFEKTKGSYTLGLELTKAENGNMNISWYLDDVLCATYPGAFGVEYGSNSMIYVGTNISEATYDWWEYTPNYEWGD
ncbi:MAG: BACON domain-containing protein [Bacteroides xylanisolvens]